MPRRSEKKIQKRRLRSGKKSFLSHEVRINVFHGAFIYGLLQGWDMDSVLDFSNAMAGLNCTAIGARGGIRTQREARELMATGSRHVNPAYVSGRNSVKSRKNAVRGRR